MNEDQIRIELFYWLKQKSIENAGVFDVEVLRKGFPYKGNYITLIGAKGIWFPKGFSIPISITTTTGGPYNDGFTDDGLLNYRYRGENPNHRDNIGLREAAKNRVPLVYFHSIKPGKYIAVWPVFIVQDNPAALSVTAAIEPAYSDFAIDSIGSSLMPNSDEDSKLGIRRYTTAVIKQRLHQSAFREYVLSAYDRQCCMCRLKHSELLDAAHIIPDAEEGGEPIVPNGLSLCKIHHAAYDRNIIGITPDYEIKIRRDILEEVDGPMLKYGIQSMDSKKIILPSRKGDYPDPEKLEKRYQLFAS